MLVAYGQSVGLKMGTSKRVVVTRGIREDSSGSIAERRLDLVDDNFETRDTCSEFLHSCNGN